MFYYCVSDRAAADTDAANADKAPGTRVRAARISEANSGSLMPPPPIPQPGSARAAERSKSHAPTPAPKQVPPVPARHSSLAPSAYYPPLGMQGLHKRNLNPPSTCSYVLVDLVFCAHSRSQRSSCLTPRTPRSPRSSSTSRRSLPQRAHQRTAHRTLPRPLTWTRRPLRWKRH